MPFPFISKPNVNNAYEDKKGDLILLNVQSGDAGAYICKASNSFGTASSVVTLVVHGNSHNLHLTWAPVLTNDLTLSHLGSSWPLP